VIWRSLDAHPPTDPIADQIDPRRIDRVVPAGERLNASASSIGGLLIVPVSTRARCAAHATS